MRSESLQANTPRAWVHRGRRALSAVATTILLILVAVGASVLLYSWFSGAAGHNHAAREAELYSAARVEAVQVRDGYLYVEVLNIGKATLSLRGSSAFLVGPNGVAVARVELEPTGSKTSIAPGESATLRGALPAGLEPGSYRVEVSIDGVTAGYAALSLTAVSGGGGGGAGGGGGVKIYKAEVDISYTGSQDLRDYPVKVELSPDWGGWNLVAANGSNIYFTDEKGDPLYYWIQTLNKEGRQAVIWVKVPLIRAGSTTKIYMDIIKEGSNPYSNYNDPRRVFPFFVSPATSNTSEWSEETHDHPRCGWRRPARFNFYKDDDREFVLQIILDPSCITYVNEAFYVIHPLTLEPGTYEIHAKLYYSYGNSGEYGTRGHRMRIWVGPLEILDHSWSTSGWKIVDIAFTLQDMATAFKIGTYWKEIVTWDVSSSNDGFSMIYIRPLATPEPVVIVKNPG